MKVIVKDMSEFEALIRISKVGQRWKHLQDFIISSLKNCSIYFHDT